MEPKFYTPQQVMELLHVGSKGTLYRMRKRGDIPEPLVVTRSHLVWPKAEFDAFFAAKVAKLPRHGKGQA